MAYGATHRANRECYLKGGKVIAYEVLAAKKIMKGDMVRLPAAGYAIAGDGSASLAQYDCFGGIALETVDNTNGGSGAAKVRCLTEGCVPLLLSASATAVGTRALHAAGSATTVTSSTVTLCASNGSDDANNFVDVGMIVAIDTDDSTVGGAASTTKMRVLLSALRQAYQ
jgi:hypothetical protein